MNRRQFIKRSTMACAAVTLLPGHLPPQAEKAAAPVYSVASGSGGKAPDWTKNLRESDIDGLGPGGKPDPNIKDTRTGASRAN